MADKHTGNPLKFKSKKELKHKIELYFSMCIKKEKPLTMSGLALALDTNRQTILNYSKKENYFDTIKKARAMCENYAEEMLFTGKGNVAGVIFNLKNNYSWRDKTEVDLGAQDSFKDLISNAINKFKEMEG